MYRRVWALLLDCLSKGCLELEKVVGSEQTCVVGGIFSSQNGTECKSAAIVGRMGNLDIIGLRLVSNGMDAGHFACAFGVYAQKVVGVVGCARNGAVGILYLSFYPTFLTVYRLTHILGQGNGCAARGIKFVDMVHLFHPHVILGIIVHNAGEITVDGREYSHPEREI